MPLKALEDATNELRGARTDVQRLGRRYRISRAVAGVLGVIVLVLAYNTWQVHNTIGCLRTWADKTNDRSHALDKPTRDRDNALDDLLIDVAGKAGTAKLARDVADAGRASAARLDALRAHPVPPSPQLLCGGTGWW